jgi:hypothetical protein
LSNGDKDDKVKDKVCDKVKDKVCDKVELSRAGRTTAKPLNRPLSISAALLPMWLSSDSISFVN